MSSTSSSPERSGAPRPAAAAFVQVGRILRPHGLRGEVVVEVSSEVVGRFAAGSELWLRRGEGELRPLRVASGSVHGGTARVRFEGCASRDDAEALRDCALEVPVDRVPRPPAGSYWHHELVGATCRDRQAGDLGTVEELVEHGGRLLLRVRGAVGDLLIPFAEPFLGGLDRETRTLTVDLPPGLLETCVSRS